MPRQSIAFVGLALLLFSGLGCEPTATTEDTNDAKSGDGTEVKDFADGVAQLKTLHATIRDDFSTGGDAHHALHEVGHLLAGLPELVDEAGLDEAGVESAKAAIEKMMDGYGDIDNALHVKEEPDYDGVSASLDEAMTTLSGLVGDG